MPCISPGNPEHGMDSMQTDVSVKKMERSLGKDTPAKEGIVPSFARIYLASEEGI